MTPIAPYHRRPARLIRREFPDGWRIKLYGLALPGSAPRAELVEATSAAAAAVLPRPAQAEGRYGTGFAIAHDANGACFALIYWWQSSNELHQRQFVAPHGDPGSLSPIVHAAAGCVWELGIVDFERRAWTEDVLANPAGPDLNAYFARQLDGEV